VGPWRTVAIAMETSPEWRNEHFWPDYCARIPLAADRPARGSAGRWLVSDRLAIPDRLAKTVLFNTSCSVIACQNVVASLDRVFEPS